MSHSYDVRGNAGGSLAGRSMNRLAEAPIGGLHLLATFEVPPADRRTDGGEPPETEVVDSVTCPGASTPEYVDPEFGEAADVESLVSYLGLDFVEHELFADRFITDADDVVYTSRGVGQYQLLCVYSAGRGVLVVVDEDEAVRPLVERARSVLTET